MAVVKSNAYGHGLVHVAQQLACSQLRVTNNRLWFGVDSITEALRLRREGIKNPILVLGYTLPARLMEAAAHNIALTVSTFETLTAIERLKRRPAIHLKIDTGMHRQGFFLADVSKLISRLIQANIRPEGVYTHFAGAKNPDDRRSTKTQISAFNRVLLHIRNAGFTGIIRHAAASAGTLLFPESHFDMVRVGMGLYGYWPSDAIKNKKRNIKKETIRLKPVLTWKTVVAEVKNIPQRAAVGYDGTESVRRPSQIAVLPVGYWHGFDRGLSSKGEVLIRGRRAKVLGRISMDMTVADVTGIPGVRVGDETVIIGRQKKETLGADDMGLRIGTTAYEILTRINPLIKRILINE